MVDSIANMFTAIKNASAVLKETVVVPHSKFKMEILKVLKKEGYIKDAIKRGKKVKKTIEISLLFRDGIPVIKNIKRISKSSCRVYSGSKDLYNFGSGRGTVILSTPKGVLTEKQARKQKIGGEVIAEIY